MRTPHNRVKIDVRAEDEDLSYKQEGKMCGPGFVESVQENLKKSRRWGWCTVAITASIKFGDRKIEATTYLGACSYISKQDFIENSGYYEQMVTEAVEGLESYVDTYVKSLTNQIDSLAGFYPLDADSFKSVTKALTMAKPSLFAEPAIKLV